MLQLVRNGRSLDRLSVAAAHIETAIAHINNEAQTHVPCTSGGDHGEVDALRLLVLALSDIRAELARGVRFGSGNDRGPRHRGQLSQFSATIRDQRPGAGASRYSLPIW